MKGEMRTIDSIRPYENNPRQNDADERLGPGLLGQSEVLTPQCLFVTVPTENHRERRELGKYHPCKDLRFSQKRGLL
jgi:hypothetical protein